MNKNLLMIILEGMFYWAGIMAFLRYLNGG
jgi:hypothetical protein